MSSISSPSPRVGFIEWSWKGMQAKTYYRLSFPSAKKTPLIVLHGGPGSTHNYFELLDSVSLSDHRPVLLYDQLGCGNSTKVEDLLSQDISSEERSKILNSFYCSECWLHELEEVRKQLGIKEAHIMGHSWGGMLLIMYLCDCMPKGVKSATLSSSLCSVTLWEKETERLVRGMEEKYSVPLLLSSKTLDFTSQESQEAMDKYTSNFVCGNFSKDKDPECMTREKKSGHVSYMIAWGPSEFKATGNLRNYEYTDKLKYIKCPVLLMSGVNDESTPYMNKTMFDNLRTEKKHWELFPASRHMSYYEEHNKYCEVLADFLNQND